MDPSLDSIFLQDCISAKLQLQIVDTLVRYGKSPLMTDTITAGAFGLHAELKNAGKAICVAAVLGQEDEVTEACCLSSHF